MAAQEGTGYTFSDLGIQPGEEITDTIFGKFRSCSSLEKKEIAFLVISLLSTLGVFGTTIERIVNIDKSSADFTFAIVLSINSLFCILYIVSGVFSESPYELAVLVFATGVVWLYLLLNYLISEKGPFKLARLVTASVLGPCIIVLGVLLIKSYTESRNLIFRTVCNATTARQDMCNTLYLFIGLLKGDLQVTVNMAVLILTSGFELDLEDIIVLPLASTVAIISAVLGYASVRWENKIFAKCYAPLWISSLAYAVYLIYKSIGDLINHNQNSDMLNAIRAVTLVAAAVSIVVRGLLLLYGIRVYLNFGKGLKERVYGQQATESIANMSVQHA